MQNNKKTVFRIRKKREGEITDYSSEKKQRTNDNSMIDIDMHSKKCCKCSTICQNLVFEHDQFKCEHRHLLCIRCCNNFK